MNEQKALENAEDVTITRYLIIILMVMFFPKERKKEEEEEEETMDAIAHSAREDKVSVLISDFNECLQNGPLC